MEPILRTVAREYSSRYKDLKNICFLFPNKRCRVFLRKYFDEVDIHTEDLPHILTISEFMAQVARQYEASHIEQLFTLYNAYSEILNEGEDREVNVTDFETFRRWGETVLSDFNVVDTNMADPAKIFKNIKDYRELTTNFLTEDQKEVMKEYFGIDNFDDPEEFWKNFDDPDNLSELRKRFLNLWQILAPLHDRFVEKLSERGLGSAGSIYRKAAERIESMGKRALPYKKIVAVGFNALSESERRVFKFLQKVEGFKQYDEYIDFIWDASGPFFNNQNFSASRFVKYNIKHFPSPEWMKPFLKKGGNDDYPEITLVSSPSNTAQAKVAGEILREYIITENGKENLGDSEVALVVPDEQLLSNLIYSLPEEVGDINLTMGFSLRQTSIVSFMNLVRRLYAGMRESKKGNQFYVKDLRLFFSHPFSIILFNGESIENLFSYIKQNHKVSISITEISTYLNEAEEIFEFPLKKEMGDRIFNKINGLLDNLTEKIKDKDEDPDSNQDLAYIQIYQEYVKGLQETIEHYEIALSNLSLMQMIEKLVASEKIGFEGEPLSGLQVMGTLETRTLDFKEVIILSMNEGIMPRKANVSSFIPEVLRKAYGLPPARYAEEIFSYYFYRLLSRAEKVTLIYDGRTISGMRGGESRYLLQLRQYLPKEKLKEVAWQFRLQNRETEEINVEKTPEIIGMTKSFTAQDDTRKNLSASSLNTYRECQVKFFLQNLLNINSDPETEDYMDAITVGDVLHEVMMQLYMPEDLQRKLLSQPIIITKEFLEDILEKPEIIRTLVANNINRIYYRKKENGNSNYESGVIEIIAGQIEDLVREIIKYDLSLVPFNLYGCEISQNIRVKLSTGRTVNFRFAIDRFDEIEIDGEKHLRIIDYKTGGRKRVATNIEEIFEGGYGSEQIFQLFTYAWLLGKIGMKGWEDVITEIYFVPDLISGKGGLPEIGKEQVKSFRPYFNEFNEKFESMVESIFQPGIFCPTKDVSMCEYCGFRTLCTTL